jgi:hypothetical protein
MAKEKPNTRAPRAIPTTEPVDKQFGAGGGSAVVDVAGSDP